MQTIILGFGVTRMLICNEGLAKTRNAASIKADTAAVSLVKRSDFSRPAEIRGLISTYLQIKNGITSHYSKDVAAGGKQLVSALTKVNSESFTSAQNKTLIEVEDDIIENAEHIGTNEAHIGHQPGNFDLLSQDIYELVKEQRLQFADFLSNCLPLLKFKNFTYIPMYEAFCRMKKAYWLSSSKTIKIPYFSNAMLTCGKVVETVNQ